MVAKAAPALLAAAAKGISATSAFTAFSAGATALSTIGAFQQQRAAAAQDKINARIADTRAAQIDTQRREELNQSLGAVASARAATGLGPSTTGRAILADFRRVMERDREIEVGNERSRASALRASARSRMQGARFSLVTGALQTGATLFRKGS